MFDAIMGTSTHQQCLALRDNHSFYKIYSVFLCMWERSKQNVTEPLSNAFQRKLLSARTMNLSSYMYMVCDDDRQHISRFFDTNATQPGKIIMNFIHHACEKQVFPVFIDFCLFCDCDFHLGLMITKFIDFDRPNDHSA